MMMLYPIGFEEVHASLNQKERIVFAMLLSPLLWLCSALLVCLACDQGNEEPLDESRIIWGQSIDNVEIGDDSTVVIQKLGMPDTIYGDDFIGSIFRYETGEHALMHVSISGDPGLGLGTISLEVDPPYAGTTKEGIGISSRREQVVTHYGEPDLEENFINMYSLEQATFSLTYDTGLAIIRISMSTP